MGRPRVVALAMHAGYRCRHSGVCCGAGWDVPVERSPAARIRDAVARGVLGRPPDGIGVDPIVAGRWLPADMGGFLAHRANGACIFFDHDGRRLCEVHRVLGEGALGQACRQFPRLASHDARGTEVSLSHFCPTAAGMLMNEQDAMLVDATEAYPGAATFEGLEARDALPPLLEPGILFSFDGWTAWQHFALESLAEGPDTATALATVAAAAEQVRAWRPREGEFADYVVRMLDAVRMRRAPFATAPPAWPTREEAAASWDVALDAVPSAFTLPPAPDWSRWADAEDECRAGDRILRRYLAARSVGAWVAYQGRGVRTWVRWLALCWHVVMACRCHAPEPASPTESGVLEAVRRADLVLVHLADPQCLADTLSALEARPLAGSLLPFDAP